MSGKCTFQIMPVLFMVALMSILVGGGLLLALSPPILLWSPVVMGVDGIWGYRITVVGFAVWLAATLGLAIGIGSRPDLARGWLRFLLCNASVLSLFCEFWYLGYYMSEHWMHIIDLGAPWSWLGALSAVSFLVSFLELRKHSKRIAKSLLGPVLTVPALWLWISFCIIWFDPFF